MALPVRKTFSFEEAVKEVSVRCSVSPETAEAALERAIQDRAIQPEARARRPRGGATGGGSANRGRLKRANFEAWIASGAAPDGSRPRTPYEARLMSGLHKHAEERRAEESNIAGSDLIPYAEAVKMAGPVLFGAHWIGPPSEDDKLVLEFGEAHARYAEVRHRDVEREAQFNRVERWLLKLELVIELRGHRYVPRDRLEAAFAEYARRPSLPGPQAAGSEDASSAPASSAAEAPLRAALAATAPAPAAPSEPTPFKPLRRRPGPKGPTDRDAEIRKLLDDGKRPGVNTPWKTFCDAVRDACQNSRLGDGRAVPGYGDRAIQREVRSIQDEIGRI